MQCLYGYLLPGAAEILGGVRPKGSAGAEADLGRRQAAPVEVVLRPAVDRRFCRLKDDGAQVGGGEGGVVGGRRGNACGDRQAVPALHGVRCLTAVEVTVHLPRRPWHGGALAAGRGCHRWRIHPALLYIQSGELTPTLRRLLGHGVK